MEEHIASDPRDVRPLGAPSAVLRAQVHAHPVEQLHAGLSIIEYHRLPLH